MRGNKFLAKLLCLLLFFAAWLNIGSDCLAEAAKPALTDGTDNRLSHFISILKQRKLTESELNDLQAVLQKSSNQALVHYALGLCEQRSGYVELAADEYERAIALDKTLLDPVLLMLAYKAHTGQLESVRILARSAISNFNSQHELTRLGQILSAVKEYSLAEEAYHKAEKLCPNSPEIAIERAAVLLVLGQWEAAELEADKGLKEDKTRYQALPIKIEALLGQRKVEATFPYAKELLQADPGGYDSNLLAGRIAYRIDKPEEAVSPWLKVLAHSAFDDQKHLAKIKWRLIEVIKKVPRKVLLEKIAQVYRELGNANLQGPYLLALGDVFDKMEWRQEAIACYLDGIAIYPAYARAYMRIGRDVEICSGDLVKAHDFYAKACELDPKDIELQVCLTRNSARLNNIHNDVAERLKGYFKKIQ